MLGDKYICSQIKLIPKTAFNAAFGILLFNYQTILVRIYVQSFVITYVCGYYLSCNKRFHIALNVSLQRSCTKCRVKAVVDDVSLALSVTSNLSCLSESLPLRSLSIRSTILVMFSLISGL